MCGCLVLAKADQGRCKVGQATQEMGKGEEGEVVLFACLLSHKANNWMFGVFVQVNLKQSRKYFWGVHPKAAKYVNTAREMHLMDLLSYHHNNELACINTSQSLSCVPFAKDHNQPLPCLTCSAKAVPSFIEYVCRKAWPLVSTTTISYWLAYPRLGRMENSSCFQRMMRTNPATLLAGKSWVWWGSPLTVWWGWMTLQNRPFVFKFQTVWFEQMTLWSPHHFWGPRHYHLKSTQVLHSIGGNAMSLRPALAGLCAAIGCTDPKKFRLKWLKQYASIRW